MTLENAIDIVSKILCNKLSRPSQLITDSSIHYSLTGSVFCMDEIELSYLLLEIEKTIGIKFSPEDLINYSFNNVNNISKLIVEKTGEN